MMRLKARLSFARWAELAEAGKMPHVRASLRDLDDRLSKLVEGPANEHMAAALIWGSAASVWRDGEFHVLTPRDFS